MPANRSAASSKRVIYVYLSSLMHTSFNESLLATTRALLSNTGHDLLSTFLKVMLVSRRLTGGKTRLTLEVCTRLPWGNIRTLNEN